MRRFATLDLVDWLVLGLLVGALFVQRAVVLDLDGELDAVEQLQALEAKRTTALAARVDALLERAWDDELELRELELQARPPLDPVWDAHLARPSLPATTITPSYWVKLTCDHVICPGTISYTPAGCTITCSRCGAHTP